jgi:hypothetical protein
MSLYGVSADTIEANQVWEASGGDQKNYFLTLELKSVVLDSQPTPHWQCLMLERGHTTLTSLGLIDSAVLWKRIA